MHRILLACRDHDFTPQAVRNVREQLYALSSRASYSQLTGTPTEP